MLAVVDIGAAVYVVRSNHAPHSAAERPPSVTVPTTPAPTTPAPISGSPSLGIEATSATTSGQPVIAFLGDDWTLGAGASSRAARFTSVLCAELHAQQRNFGVDGTGYAKSSAAGGPYSSRVEAVVAADPQVVVVSGGRNDRSDSPATAAERAAELFARLHAKLPDAALIAIAPFWGDSDQPPEIVTLGHAVERAVDRAGGVYLDIPDPLHGHPSFMADDADPNDKGYAAIAAALAPQLAPLVPS